uniref:TPR_REGION domain-containing protein n=1 Tax=Globodera pallida TaxID=36090 RepID=A0A183CDH7_GLOPA
MSEQNLSQIHYWIRESYFGTALCQIDEELRSISEGQRWNLKLLRAFCTIRLGSPAEGIRLLNGVLKDSSASEFKLAVLHGLRIAHSSEKHTDKVAISEIERQIHSLWTQSSDNGTYVAAYLLLLDAQFERARPLVEKLSPHSNSMFLSLRGWLDVLSGSGTQTAEDLFDRAIALDKSLDAYLGKAKLLETKQNAIEMQTVLSALLNVNSSFLPAYLEMAKGAAMTRGWEAATELCQRALLIQSDCIPALLLDFVLTSLIHGENVTGEPILNELVEALTQTEGSNQRKLIEIGLFLSSVMVDREKIAEQARKLTDRALSLVQNNKAMILKSRLLLAEGNKSQAQQLALMAVKMVSEEKGGEGDESAVIAMIRAQIEVTSSKNIKEAGQQLEFLRETHPKIVEEARYHFLCALLAIREQKGASQLEAFGHLRNCVDIHFDAHRKSGTFSLDQLAKLDVTFCVEVAELFLEMASTVSAAPKECERVLTAARENCPGLTKPTFLLAKAKLALGETATAEQLLRICVDKNSNNSEAYLLLAQIHVQKNELDEASKLLDIGLGFNFRVREHPLYFLIKARLEKRARRVEASIDLLRNALELFDKWQHELGFVESDRICITLELVDSLQMLNLIGEADKCMNEAVERYRGKASEEQQLVLMSAQLRLQRGNVDGALKALQAVKADQPNYRAARIKMAQLYLEVKHDKHKFALCYRDLLEQDPSPQTYELLGDAYVSVQEPELAIEAYETAMRRAPKDHQLAEKIGNAYVKCHLYNKAVTFYEAAIKSGRQNLRIRFAEQLFQMGNFEKCKKMLKNVLDEQGEPSEVATMREYVSYLMLMSRLLIEQNDWEQSSKDLQRARQLQLKVIARGAGREGINVTEEKQLAATLSAHANPFRAEREKRLPQGDIWLSIYASMGKLQLCNQQCQQVLAIEPNNNEATLLLADLMYQRNEGEEAMKHFSQLLDRNPNLYHALARYIELGWRQGSIELGEKRLRNALENNPRATVDAGFNFCKGLIEWYTGEPNAALQAFSRARRDLEWGERALYNMIEICLNPDNEILGADVGEQQMSPEDAQEANESYKAADRFFKELRHKSMLDQRYKLVENFILLASPNKANVQKALSNFTELCKTDGTTEGEANLSVGAILGSARALLMLKQTQKAKAQLKKVLGHAWNLDEAEYLQQCWLLLADIYIDQSKNDQAVNILRSSCSKAYEYTAFVCEKEQKYADAAANYEAAWNVRKRMNPRIGYKLAYNHFKCHRLFECIEVCHAVLKQYPTYPKIKKEILDKARANIRM